METKINIKIKMDSKKEINLDYEQGKELYEKLKQIYEKTSVSYPCYPIIYHEPYKITWGTGEYNTTTYEVKIQS